MNMPLLAATRDRIAQLKQTIAKFPDRSYQAREQLDNDNRAIAYLERKPEPRPPEPPVPEYQKQQIEALDILPMAEQPAYVEAFGLLQRFKTELAAVTQRLQDLRDVESGGELVDDPMALLDGGMPAPAIHAEIAALVLKQAALLKAVKQHEAMLLAVESRLGAEAGNKALKEHHKRVAAIRTALLALHEANRQEIALRRGLEQRGYDRHNLKASTFRASDLDPYNADGTFAHYWMQEHRAVVG